MCAAEIAVTVQLGTNTLVGTNPIRIIEAVNRILEPSAIAVPLPAPRIPSLWDGKAAERIVTILLK